MDEKVKAGFCFSLLQSPALYQLTGCIRDKEMNDYDKLVAQLRSTFGLSDTAQQGQHASSLLAGNYTSQCNVPCKPRQSRTSKERGAVVCCAICQVDDMTDHLVRLCGSPFCNLEVAIPAGDNMMPCTSLDYIASSEGDRQDVWFTPTSCNLSSTDIIEMKQFLQSLALFSALAAAHPLSATRSFINHRKNDTWVVGQTVSTTSGPVQGHAASEASEVSEYLGIPFAQPPTGRLRFEPPVAYNGSSTINGTDYVSPQPVFYLKLLLLFVSIISSASSVVVTHHG